MLKRLFCKHNKLELIQEGDWYNGSASSLPRNILNNEEHRILTYKCNDCSKHVELIEVGIK